MATVAEEFLEAPPEKAPSAAEAFLLSKPTTLPSNTFLGPVEAPSPAEEPTPAEAARRLGLPGAERLQDGLIKGPSQEETEKPLITLPVAAKNLLGKVTARAFLGQVGALVPERVTSEVGESLGGLIEGMTSPAGIATGVAATLAPAVVLPGMIREGFDAGVRQIAEGKPFAGATTIGIAALPAVGLTARALAGSSKALGETRPGTATPPPLPAVEVPYLIDFLPHAEAKQVFSQPFGAGRIPVLGRVVDPNAKVSAGPLPEALATFAAEKHGVAPAAASNVGLRLKAKGVDEAFPVDPKTGELTTVQPTRPGQSLAPADVMEALQRDPESYVLNDAQRAAFGELEKWRLEVEALEKKHGITSEIVATEEGDTGYFPRIVIKRPETDVAPLTGGGRVGAKQFFQKSRMFETEREGMARGYQYEPSIEARATSRTERSYRAIADKRLAEDPTLGARTRQQVEAELREAYSEEIGTGTMTEAKLQQIVDSVEHKGSVWGQPGFFGKIFDPETANTLNKAFPQADSAFRHHFVKANNALKAMRLSADVGAPLIQGLPTMFRNPVTWSKAVYNSLKAIPDAKVMALYAEKNAALLNELARYGSGVGRLPEMLAGLEKGGVVERIPVAGQVFKAAGRQFETFLDVAKVELWKAWREVTPEGEKLSVIRAIESQLSTGRMESIGVSRNRALAERALLLAPSYYRGAVNLVAAIGERGVAGNIARQALGAYAAGGVAAFYGIAQALGMDEEEIQERLNPADNFLMWDVEVAGRKLNIGFGGIYRSLLRLVANMTVTSVENPGNWLSLTSSKNPLVRWYRGHAAAVPGITWDAITGRDFLGAESDLTTLGQSVVPLAAQPLGGPIKDVLKDREPELEPTAVEVGASLIGLSAYPEKRKR